MKWYNYTVDGESGLVYMDLNSSSPSNPVVLLENLGRSLIHAIDGAVPDNIWILNYRHRLFSIVQRVFKLQYLCYRINMVYCKSIK